MVMDDTTRFTIYPLRNRNAVDDPTPAYPGARFNSAGYCTNHSNVRLCTVTDEGRYKILRKVCFKCGSSALRSQNLSRVNTLHGCAKKEVRSRELPKDMLSATATTLDGGSGGADSTNANARAANPTTNEAEKELRRKKTRDGTKKKSKKSKKSRSETSKKDRKSLRNSTTDSTAISSSPQVVELRRKLERSTRRSRSRSLSTTTSRTVTSLSLSELSERYPPPPRSLSRSRSKSRNSNRDATTATAAAKKDDTKNKIKPMRRDGTLVNISSSESVEAKVKEITKSKTTKADYYAELGKLITTSSKDEDNTTLPTLSSCCPSTPESFKSKDAVFSYDKAGLIVELYKKEEESNELDQNSGSRGRERKGVLRRMPKLKPRYSSTKNGREE